MSSAIDAGSVFDDLFAAGSGRFVRDDGNVEHLAVHQWAGDTDDVDRHLFTDQCAGPTLDIGCGPGRLVGELVNLKIPALGIDVSHEAIRRTRVRGALALRLDVFDEVPGAGHWSHALLADGNIGIGGHPVRLLNRVRELLGPEGTVLAEVAPRGTGVIRDQRRLWVNGRYSSPFSWAVVGLDAIEQVAEEAGLTVTATRSMNGRHTVTLART
ncbi:MAG: hypothetical protein P1U38_16600 [Aeromicrobium sp.]|uniref:methyltransferase domain-containing protein n=1 Tax=Aeromicrobium sp. TaxID=1871063 RepID=UPI00263912F2|nr:methyltransferase domain-containing protein [Aeromicrobium sp.]MDF1706386.1 hypothetical protein [Aeromicrobium sp.]